MGSSREVQERRREAIRAILNDEESPIADQKELVELLKSKGIPATQSSVSRDLRDLGAVRVQGRYQILDWLAVGESPILKAKGIVLSMVTVGTDQILVKTEPGAGAFVGELLERSQWEDISGTVAGYRSVLICTPGKFFRDLVWDLLDHYLGPAREEEKKEEGEQGAPKTEG